MDVWGEVLPPKEGLNLSDREFDDQVVARGVGEHLVANHQGLSPNPHTGLVP